MKKLQLLVQQPMAGHFYWSVVELQTADPRRGVVASASAPLPTHAAARDAGLVALLRHHRRQGQDGVLPPRDVAMARPLESTLQ